MQERLALLPDDITDNDLTDLFTRQVVGKMQQVSKTWQAKLFDNGKPHWKKRVIAILHLQDPIELALLNTCGDDRNIYIRLSRLYAIKSYLPTRLQHFITNPDRYRRLVILASCVNNESLLPWVLKPYRAYWLELNMYAGSDTINLKYFHQQNLIRELLQCNNAVTNNFCDFKFLPDPALLARTGNITLLRRYAETRSIFSSGPSLEYNSILTRAIEANQSKVVVYCLEELNVKPSNQHISAAAKTGNVAIFNLIISKLPSLEVNVCINRTSITALLNALTVGNVTSVRSLIADTSVIHLLQQSPLIEFLNLAVKLGDITILRTLLNLKSRNETPLFIPTSETFCHAVRSNNVAIPNELVTFLQANNLAIPSFELALDKALKSNQPDMLQFFLDCPYQHSSYCANTKKIKAFIAALPNHLPLVDLLANPNLFALIMKSITTAIDTYDPFATPSKELMNTIVATGDVKIMRFMFSTHKGKLQVDTRMLWSAIANNHLEMVELLLTEFPAHRSTLFSKQKNSMHISPTNSPGLSNPAMLRLLFTQLVCASISDVADFAQKLLPSFRLYAGNRNLNLFNCEISFRTSLIDLTKHINPTKNLAVAFTLDPQHLLNQTLAALHEPTHYGLHSVHAQSLQQHFCKLLDERMQDPKLLPGEKMLITETRQQLASITLLPERLQIGQNSAK